MTTKRIGALVKNEIRLHGQGALMVQAAILLLLVVGYQLRPGSGAAFALLVNCNWMTALAWSEWLVSREKTKGTIGWLRSLPVSDSEIVTAKFVAHALCCAVFWAGTSWLALDVFRPDPESWVVGQLALLTLGGLSIASRWRFSQRLGSLAPLLVLLPIVLLFRSPTVQRVAMPLLTALWASGSGKLVAMAALAAAYATTWGATILWVARVDTSDLIE